VGTSRKAGHILDTVLSSRSDLSTDEVKAGLRRLRQGQALARPTTVQLLDDRLRRAIAADAVGDSGAEDIIRVVGALRQAIDRLGPHERYLAQVDFNLLAEHSYPTLTERQESLARARKCTAKTIRRHSDQALETLALIILTAGSGVPQDPEPVTTIVEVDQQAWPEALCRFWRLSAGAAVDIVCSEIPESERPSFALPQDRNYLRYAKFADLDSLVYVRTRLAQVSPGSVVRDFSPSEHFGTDARTLIVIGGPPWNAKFREFQPQLPFRFEPHPLGEDDPFVVPQLGARLAPRWTSSDELLEDVAVFARLTLARGTTAYLLAGCLTLGVLGAAQCLLHGEQGAANARFIDATVGEADFVLATTARRIGGITDITDLSRDKPLLLLARATGGAFEVVIDGTSNAAVESPAHVPGRR
jgi:hypothetical protein